ncbi:MAG: hypothetical protein KIT84_03300 [Labilithrix sp.]|nr:hypothetical protein [Labilithrix sp.]MCW5810009.1 hypothetical protein [Labilithrix sp.]
MKLRIRGDSLRLRLTRPEVDALRERGRVEDATSFPDGAVFRYTLEVGAATTASFDARGIVVTLERGEAEAWCTSESVGVRGAVGPSSILVEKDFACLRPREDEDPAEHFPHPDAK